MKIERKPLRRAFWSAFGKLISVGLGAGWGSIMYQMIGSDTIEKAVGASVLAIISFGALLFAEYEREVE